MTVYRADKIVLHPDRIRQFCCGMQPIPLQVQLIISDLCSQDCRFCAYRMEGYSSNELFPVRDGSGATIDKNPKRWIPLEKVDEILNDCRSLGVRAIQITGGGEPTVHPEHAQIFTRVRQIGLDLGVVTNGVRLEDSEAIEALVATGAETWLRISMDAGNSETYRSIRRCPPSHWTRVWSNIEKIVTARAQTMRSPLTIGIGFVVNADNYKEVVDATRRARESGVDNIRISGMFQPHGIAYFSPFLEEARSLCHEARQLATEQFAVIDLFSDRIEDLQQGRPDYAFCGYQHLCAYIGADLNVYRCCVFSYNQRGLLGSIRNQSFATLWTGEAKRADFDRFDARECTHCQHNSKNRAILAAILAHRHGNFI
jgi:wyosine [tRNA(Phe)-imidazoG37] synthetase (radical SAM superfamily)